MYSVISPRQQWLVVASYHMSHSIVKLFGLKIRMGFLSWFASPYSSPTRFGSFSGKLNRLLQHSIDVIINSATFAFEQILRLFRSIIKLVSYVIWNVLCCYFCFFFFIFFLFVFHHPTTTTKIINQLALNHPADAFTCYMPAIYLLRFALIKVNIDGSLNDLKWPRLVFLSVLCRSVVDMSDASCNPHNFHLIISTSDWLESNHYRLPTSIDERAERHN